MKNIISKLNLILFPAILIFAFFVSILESYKYVGFFQKHFLIPSSIIYLLSLFSFTYLISLRDSLRQLKKNRFLQVFFRLGLIAFLITLLVYVIFSSFDIVFFKNFSFGNFHIQPANLIFSVGLSLETVFLYFVTHQNFTELKNSIYRNIKLNIKYIWNDAINTTLAELRRKKVKLGKPLGLDKKIKQVNVIFATALLLLAGFGLYNLFVCVQSLVSADAYIIFHLNLTYRQKMEQEWGILFYMVEVIQDNTPDHSKILFPPFIAPWSVIGNINQVRYFLGNRILLNAKDADSVDGNPDYIIIARGGLHAIYDVVKSEDEYGWPRVFVPAETIWYLKPGTWNPVEVHKDFDPTDPINKNAWGLIKVDKSRL
jgi:hypothetical protein